MSSSTASTISSISLITPSFVPHYKPKECFEYFFTPNLDHDGYVKCLCECFSHDEEIDLTEDTNNVDKVNAKEDRYGDSLLKKARKESSNSTSSYINLSWIPPTTCAIERLFSQCKHALSELRTRMTPLHFEAIMILYANWDLWSARTVRDAMKRPVDLVIGIAAEEAQREIMEDDEDNEGFFLDDF